MYRNLIDKCHYFLLTLDTSIFFLTLLNLLESLVQCWIEVVKSDILSLFHMLAVKMFSILQLILMLVVGFYSWPLSSRGRSFLFLGYGEILSWTVILFHQKSFLNLLKLPYVFLSFILLTWRVTWINLGVLNQLEFLA